MVQNGNSVTVVLTIFIIRLETLKGFHLHHLGFPLVCQFYFKLTPRVQSTFWNPDELFNLKLFNNYFNIVSNIKTNTSICFFLFLYVQQIDYWNDKFYRKVDIKHDFFHYQNAQTGTDLTIMSENAASFGVQYRYSLVLAV